MRWDACILPDCADPIRRLAAESALFEQLPPDRGRLMLWRSVPSIVLGKNQNPWRECSPDLIRSEGGILARRQSGGGAVYHDPGNVCYSMMMPKEGYCPDLVGEVVCIALRGLGINASVGDRHVLQLGDHKISGTAFCHRRNRVLHHGTLLLSADLDRLRRWLAPAISHIETRAVASVPSPVVNLQSCVPDLRASDVMNAICEAFQVEGEVVPDAGVVAAEHKRFSHEDWLFGLTPPFSLPAADSEITVRKGRVERAPAVFAHLQGQWFHPDKLISS